MPERPSNHLLQLFITYSYSNRPDQAKQAGILRGYCSRSWQEQAAAVRPDRYGTVQVILRSPRECVQSRHHVHHARKIAELVPPARGYRMSVLRVTLHISITYRHIPTRNARKASLTGSRRPLSSPRSAGAASENGEACQTGGCEGESSEASAACRCLQCCSSK